MSEERAVKVEAILACGMVADGREVFLDVQMQGQSWRLVFDLVMLRPTAITLLTAADAAQAASPLAGLTNLIRATGVEVGLVEGPEERFALSLRLETGAGLAVSLPTGAAAGLATALAPLTRPSGDTAPPGSGERSH